MPCYSPLKGFRNVETGGIQFRREGGGEKMEVACGSCLGCRLDRSRMWAMRIIHESTLWETRGGNCFVTLTYDDEHVPGDWSLDKTHFQKFMKRLRKGSEDTIRFFHAGEYGNVCRHNLEVSNCDRCNVGRPHYHAVLFNREFRDLELVGSQNGVPYFTSAELEGFWKNGFVQVGELNFKSAAYVARYCLKKVTGERADEHYTYIDDYGVMTELESEYTTMSRRPGIGRKWYEKYKGDLFPSDEVPVPGEGVLRGMPRYYDDLCAAEEPELREEIRKLRDVFRREHASEYTPSRLMQKYKVKKRQVEILRREL